MFAKLSDFTPYQTAQGSPRVHPFQPSRATAGQLVRGKVLCTQTNITREHEKGLLHHPGNQGRAFYGSHLASLNGLLLTDFKITLITFVYFPKCEIQSTISRYYLVLLNTEKLFPVRAFCPWRW